LLSLPEGRGEMEKIARGAWDEIDENGIGKLEVSAIPELLSILGMSSREELEQELDRDGNGLVHRDDFVNWAVSNNEKDGTFVGGGLEEGSTASSNMLGLTPDELLRKVEKMAASARNMSSSDIHEAAWKGDLELLKKYVYIDPSLSSSSDDSEWGGDYTPLHYAAYQGHADVCQFLVDDPMVDINSKTSTGCTPLFLAAQQGRADVVRMLLLAGASPIIAEDEYFFTPVDVARQHKETIFSIFKSGEEWEYEKWRQAPPQLGRPALSNAKLTSFECLLPRLDEEEEDALKVREFKVKVVELPEGGIVDLLVVPRENWSGGDEEPVIIRNLVSGSSYAVYVAGVNGMGYGEYSEMSEVISTRVPKPKKKHKEGEEGEGGERRELKEVNVLPAKKGQSPEPVEFRKKKKPVMKKKKKALAGGEVGAEVMAVGGKSKTLQSVESTKKFKAKMGKKKSGEKPTTLSLPTPTRMTPQQQELNSDESSVMDFDALSNDASATASEEDEGEADGGKEKSLEAEVQLDMPLGSWVMSANMSSVVMKGSTLFAELKKSDNTFSRAQVKVAPGTAYKNVEGVFVPE